MPSRTPGKKGRPTATRISSARLEAMIEEATVDAYGESELPAGWCSTLENHPALPFETTVLGAVVKVTKLDLRNDNCIVAVCTGGRERQAIPILDLPLPSPKPRGAEWIEAYRRWLGG